VTSAGAAVKAQGTVASGEVGHALGASGASSASNAFSARNGVAYGLLGFALAFAALPLYVVLPNYYAREFGVPLATLGAVLLGARLLDAFIDPALGRITDRLFARSASSVLAFGLVAALLLGVGFALLFFPQVQGADALVWWASAMLVLTYAGYSGLSVAHQAWAALLGGSETERSRIVAWREGLGLLGVVTASVLPSVAGMPVTTAMFAAAAARRCADFERSERVGVIQPQAHTFFRPHLGAVQSGWLQAPADCLHAQRHCQRRACHAGVVFHSRPPGRPSDDGASVSRELFFVCGAVHSAVAGLSQAHRPGT
jgi:hypothetical protein